MARIVYSPRYNIGFLGLERLHPFDSRKYGRVWRCLRKRFGASLRSMWLRTPQAAGVEHLRLVHSAAYLDRLRRPDYVAGALEVPPIRYLPSWMIDWRILQPMRWATMGTILAAREALQCGFAVNLGGGFHHAKPSEGEGFCVYSDIGLAVASLRRDGLLSPTARVAYIDLDAHQGNGVCHAFLRDSSVFIFDMYNATIYPLFDPDARERIDCDIGLCRACRDTTYLGELQDRLPGFLDSISRSAPVDLAIYNAGSDVFEDDPLGDLNISADGILQRDVFVWEALRQRNIPTVMLLSGGYTRVSYRLAANSIIRMLEMEAAVD